MIQKSKQLLIFIAVISIVLALSTKDHSKDQENKELSAPVSRSSNPSIVKAKDGDCYAPRQVNAHGVCACPNRKNYVSERN